MAKQWILAAETRNVSQVAGRWGVSDLVAQILVNRGLAPDESADAFLGPQLKNLHPPSRLSGAAQAAATIVDAIRSNARIVLYGDYDVDGTTGVAILWHVLSHVGAQVSFYVPHRVDEGYGLNAEATKRLVADGADLIISIDCGITAVDVGRELAKTDTRLIITDHHRYGAELPEAAAIVHPTLGGDYPNPHLCGAGVALKLAWAIAQASCGSDRVSADLRELLVAMMPLAALGTIADVVPLVGENRIIARHGLKGLANTALPGLRSLIDSAGVRSDKVSGYDVGFRLAPRINAAGRMGHARLAVELLTRAGEDRAREIALYLEEHNRSRQATERRILKQAVDAIERNDLASDARRAIVLASEGWHAGVIGIVAARLVDRFCRPTVVIAMEDGAGQGSARSIDAFDLSDALGACSGHLESYGGHAMAAGLRIAADRLASFTEAFVDVANNRLTGNNLVRKLRLDAQISLAELTLPIAEAISGLGPFGNGNPRPRFATDWLTLAGEPRCVGASGSHLQASFHQNDVRVRAIGFGQGSAIEDLKEHRRCRVAFEPIINDFNGRRTVEMQILDMHFPT